MPASAWQFFILNSSFFIKKLSFLIQRIHNRFAKRHPCRQKGRQQVQCQAEQESDSKDGRREKHLARHISIDTLRHSFGPLVEQRENPLTPQVDNNPRQHQSQQTTRQRQEEDLPHHLRKQYVASCTKRLTYSHLGQAALHTTGNKSAQVEGRHQ